MMRRSPLVLGALLLVGLALLVGSWTLSSLSRNAASPPGSTVPSDDGEDAAAPRRAAAWAFVSGLPPELDREAYVIQAGFLGDPAPRLEVEVPWRLGEDGDIGRQPAVGEPLDGGIVHVADDGRRSSIRRLSILDGGAAAVLGVVDEVVWDIAVAPDGSAAYLALVARDAGDEDRGVVRIALDGSGTIESVLPPGRAGAAGDVRLAAFLAFQVMLDISDDGRFLGRTLCFGVDGCASEIVDLDSGERFPAGDVEPVDLGPGGLVLRERCNLECETEVASVLTGGRLVLPAWPFDSAFVAAGDGVLVATIEQNPQPILALFDPRDGSRRELYRAPARASLVLSEREGLLWGIPPGTLLVTETVERPDPPAGAVVEFETRYLLFSLEGGAPLEAPPPAIRPIFPAGTQG